MKVDFAYLGASVVQNTASGQTVSFAPNLMRDAVSFDAPLRQPLRFREAISALHDVVVSDLRFKPRDKTAYQQWKQNEEQRLALLFREEYKRAKDEILSQRETPVSKVLEKRYEKARRRYWWLRQKYSSYLLRHDPSVWRNLMPCDPIITVHDDVVFFECFSADESSYGCLTVDREQSFGKCDELQCGTTNVDYSWDLFDHFQSLRSYRETRLRVDPSGFEVVTEGAEEYREEKIDLPDGWLRGFMQIQAAMALPMRRVSLSRECVYSLIAWQKRHRAKTSPRALRFELIPGESPVLMLEPWERRFESRSTTYNGPPGPPIRVWGIRRLEVLARTLPLAERFDVYLLGTGLPAFWVAQMGEMRLTVGLSGWTTNDWTRHSALDLLAPPADPSESDVDRVARFVQERQSSSFDELQNSLGLEPHDCCAILNRLAHAGQLIFDLGEGRYRWRQVMAEGLGELQMGDEHSELAASRQIVQSGKIEVESQSDGPGGISISSGTVDGRPVELVVDMDGFIKRGHCVCTHFKHGGLKTGPCRHLLAFRERLVSATESESSLSGWFGQFSRWTES